MKKTLCICTWNRLILGISEMAFIIDSASFFLYSNCKIFQFPRLRRWWPLRKWENRKLYSPKVRRPNKLSNWNLVKWINYKGKKNILGTKLIWTSIKNLSGILSTCNDFDSVVSGYKDMQDLFPSCNATSLLGTIFWISRF